MPSQKIYCEVEFLKRFIESFPNQISLNEEFINKQKMWIQFFEFLVQSEIYLDSIERFRVCVHENDIYLKLWKRSIEHPDRLEFLNDNFPDTTDEDCYLEENHKLMTSVFFSISNQELCDKMSAEYGILMLNNDSILNSERYFDVVSETIEAGNKSLNNWKFLEKFQHSHNSLCIVDNYLLKDEDTIDLNLIPILNYLLPFTLKVPFHISIFTQKNRPLEQPLDFNKLKLVLNEKIKRLRPDNFQFTLGIFNSNSRDFHDRYIITNNLIIESGSGFDLIRKNKDTGIEESIHRTKVTCVYKNFNKNLKYFNNDKMIDIGKFTLKSLADKYFDRKLSYLLNDKYKSFENRLLEANL